MAPHTSHRGQQEAGSAGCGLLLVTVFAIDNRVAAAQRKAGRGVVVKLLLTTHRDPAVEVSFQTTVLFVTQDAGATEGFGRCVQADLLGDPFRDGLVTVEALLFVDLAAACRVALDAVGRAVNFGVAACELAR